MELLTDTNNTYLLKQLSNENIYYKKVFDSLLFNFIYTLLPFYNIGLKIANGDNLSKRKGYTNMIKINLLLSSLLTYFCYFFQNYYFYSMNIESNGYELVLIALVIVSNSFLGCLNGFLIGNNDNKLLISFNLIYMISTFIINGVIMNLNMTNNEIIYTKNIPLLISCIYIFDKYQIYFDVSYFLSHKIEIIYFGLELMVRNIVTLFGININNMILFKLDKTQIKSQEVLSSNLNSFVNIYSPLSTIIQKKTYSNNQVNSICFTFLGVSIIVINLINYYFWNFSYLLVNLFNIFHFLVFINESKNISGNKIMRSIKVLLIIMVFKYGMYNLFEFNSSNMYYSYIIGVLFIKYLLNSIL